MIQSLRSQFSSLEQLKLKWKKFANDNIFLDLIRADVTKCAFKNYRNPRVRLMIVCLFIQKLYTFIYLIQLQFKSTEDYLKEDGQQVEYYSLYRNQETKLEGVVTAIKSDGQLGICQMALNLIILIIAQVLLTVSFRYHNIASILMLISQILDIPFRPFINQQYLLILAFNQFGLIFFLPMVVSDNLIQVFLAYTLLFVNLMARLHTMLRKDPFWFAIIFFYIINCGIALQMVTSILGNCKTIFNEKYEMTAERDNFKQILDNFDKGVLIVSGDQPTEQQQQQQSKIDKSDRPVTTASVERIVHFTNAEVKRVFGHDMENVMHNQLFQTYRFEENLLQSNLCDVSSDKNDLLSLADIIQDGWRGKNLFYINEENLDHDSNLQQSNRQVLEIEVKDQKFDRLDCLMVTIRNVTSAVKNESLNMRSKLHQMEKTTMQHEVLSQLNSIVSVSQLLMDQQNKKTTLSQGEQWQLSSIVWCSAHLLQTHVQARLYQFQIEEATQKMSVRHLRLAEIKAKIQDLILPFQLQIQEQQIVVKIHDTIGLSDLKQEFSCDWQLYLHALHNLISNAVKYCQKSGKIEICLHLKQEHHDDQIQLKTAVINSGDILSKKTVKQMNKELNQRSFDSQKFKNKDRLQQLISTKATIGMGLLNSKSITSYLGGSIKFQNSKQGQNEVRFVVRVDRSFYAPFTRQRGSISNRSQQKEGIQSLSFKSDLRSQRNYSKEASYRKSEHVLDLEAANIQTFKNLNLDNGALKPENQQRDDTFTSLSQRRLQNQNSGNSSSLLPQILPINNAKVASGFGDITYGYLAGILKDQQDSSIKMKQGSFKRANSFVEAPGKNFLGDVSKLAPIVDTITIQFQPSPFQQNDDDSHLMPRRKSTGGFGNNQNENSENSEEQKQQPEPQVVQISCKCKARVLIVDDSQLNIYPLKKMLQSKFQMSSDSALNGLQAYNKVKLNYTKACCKVVYNFILMDIRMPVMDGFTATQKILSYRAEMSQSKALRHLVQDLKIVALTAYVNIDTKTRAKEVGMSKIYGKPLSVDQLREIIEGGADDSEESA